MRCDPATSSRTDFSNSEVVIIHDAVKVLRICLAVYALTSIGVAQEGPAFTEPISLAGQWRFALDPNKEGVEKQFFKKGGFGRDFGGTRFKVHR